MKFIAPLELYGLDFTGLIALESYQPDFIDDVHKVGSFEWIVWIVCRWIGCSGLYGLDCTEGIASITMLRVDCSDRSRASTLP